MSDRGNKSYNTLIDSMRINRSQLKMVGMVTMLIDHIGAYLIPGGGWIYTLTRIIGRISMPCFAFLIAEGMAYTRSRWKYITRLLICAFITQIPYNLLEGNLLMWNPKVIFTYVLSTLIIMACEKVKNRYVRLGLFAAAILAAYLLKLEYWLAAPVFIWLFYFSRDFGQWKFYTGEDGGRRIPNLVCYIFYPAHLLIIYAIRYLIGIS